jgi:hypothetical protein
MLLTHKNQNTNTWKAQIAKKNDPIDIYEYTQLVFCI